MSGDAIKRLRGFILIEIEDDAVDLRQLVNHARHELHVRPDQLQSVIMAAIAELLTDGLIVVGDLDEGSHVRPWDLDHERTLALLATEWVSEPRIEPTPVAWIGRRRMPARRLPETS